MENSKLDNGQIKYVDLEGLQTFAKELKLRLQYRIIEETIYNDLKNEIDVLNDKCKKLFEDIQKNQIKILEQVSTINQILSEITDFDFNKSDDIIEQ